MNAFLNRPLWKRLVTQCQSMEKEDVDDYGFFVFLITYFVDDLHYKFVGASIIKIEGIAK